MHPTKHFPHVSLLVLAGVGFVFSLLFKMKEVITAIIVMRIMVQFLGQSVGIILYHQRRGTSHFPYRMWAYPLPALVGIAVWVFIFFSAELAYMEGAILMVVLGSLLFLLHAYLSDKWPFRQLLHNNTTDKSDY